MDCFVIPYIADKSESEIMPQFRWPALFYDIALAREVASCRPNKSEDWEDIARTLSVAFSTLNKPVELKGRGCRERMGRLLDKLRSEDSLSLKRSVVHCVNWYTFRDGAFLTWFTVTEIHDCRSGTEEDYRYSELTQLLEDIYTYRRDIQAALNKEKETKKRKEWDDKQMGEEMRKSAMETMARKLIMISLMTYKA